jgi:TFIIH basal transcription factor complex TTD-A subunit
MNEKKGFIIEDLDNHHLVIKADEEYRVREELNQEVSLNLFLSQIWLTPPRAGEKHIQPGIMIFLQPLLSSLHPSHPNSQLIHSAPFSRTSRTTP